MPEFDELNVIQEVNELYRLLNADNKKQFKKLFMARFLEMLAWMVVKSAVIPSEDELEDLADIYLYRLLNDPNEVVKYAYEPEVLRKRDRLEEAVAAAPSVGEKQQEMDKGLRYWSAQTAFFTDFVSDGASMEAMKKAGVKMVMWVTQRDDRVCSECLSRNGLVFPIDRVPTRPHPRCRCYCVPANVGTKYFKS